MGSSLPVPPEEHKLKDDYIVNVQVSFVALIFNDMPFQTAARNRKPVWSPYCVFLFFSFCSTMQLALILVTC